MLYNSAIEPRSMKREQRTINKLSTLRDEAYKEQAKDIELLEAKLAQVNLLVQEMRTDLSSIKHARNRRERNVLATGRLQGYEMEQASLGKADSISVTEVADLVKVLNAQIEQAANIITDSLSYRELPIPNKDLGLPVWDEISQYLGPFLCDKLRRRLQLQSELDQLMTQITLQAGLINACRFIINHWNPPYWDDDIPLSRIYRNVGRTRGQIIAGGWRAFVHGNLTDETYDHHEANKDYLKGVLIKLIFAVGGSLPSRDIFPRRYEEKVEDIATKVIQLHKIIGKDVKSMDLIAYVIPCGHHFDRSKMDNADESRRYRESNPTASVVGTVEMGLLFKKRVLSEEQNTYYEDFGLVMKPKVVLAATLEA